jgi:hypothetical protein
VAPVVATLRWGGATSTGSGSPDPLRSVVADLTLTTRITGYDPAP